MEKRSLERILSSSFVVLACVLTTATWMEGCASKKHRPHPEAYDENWGEGVYTEKLTDGPPPKTGIVRNAIATCAENPELCRKAVSLVKKVHRGVGPKVKADLELGKNKKKCYDIVRHEKAFLDASEKIYFKCLLNSKKDKIYFHEHKREWCWDSLPCTVSRSSSDKLIRNLCKCN